MRIEKGLTYPESNAERISMSGANAQDIVVTQPWILKVAAKARAATGLRVSASVCSHAIVLTCRPCL